MGEVSFAREEYTNWIQYQVVSAENTPTSNIIQTGWAVLIHLGIYTHIRIIKETDTINLRESKGEIAWGLERGEKRGKIM